MGGSKTKRPHLLMAFPAKFWSWKRRLWSIYCWHLRDLKGKILLVQWKEYKLMLPLEPGNSTLYRLIFCLETMAKVVRVNYNKLVPIIEKDNALPEWQCAFQHVHPTVEATSMVVRTSQKVRSILVSAVPYWRWNVKIVSNFAWSLLRELFTVGGWGS